MLRNTTTDCHVVEHAFYYHLPSFFVQIIVDLLHFSCLILVCCTDIAQFAIPFASSYRTKKGEDILLIITMYGAALTGRLSVMLCYPGRCPGLVGVALSARTFVLDTLAGRNVKKLGLLCDKEAIKPLS